MIVAKPASNVQGQCARALNASLQGGVKVSSPNPRSLIISSFASFKPPMVASSWSS